MTRKSRVPRRPGRLSGPGATPSLSRGWLGWVVLLTAGAFLAAGPASPPSSSPTLTTGDLTGIWAGQGDDFDLRVVFRKDGSFERVTTGPTGTESSRGRYRLTGTLLMIHPDGSTPIHFFVRAFEPGRLALAGPDGSTLNLTRQGGADTTRREGAGDVAPTPVARPAPPPGQTAPPPGLRLPGPATPPAVPPAAQPPSGPAAASGSMAPDWVRPGLRLTYYLMTGSLSGSVNGWVPDEQGEWVDRHGNRYSTERQGHASHGLIQSTVTGQDHQSVALAQPFYLFSGDDLTPFFKLTMDGLAPLDSGGDYWMHPRRQAQLCQQHPWVGVPAPGRILAKATTWRHEGHAWPATAVVILGDASRMLSVYDRDSGRLLYLSRLTREPPVIRDSSQGLPDSVSHATFLRFVGVRQLELPWLHAPLAPCLRQAAQITYQGQFNVVSPGGGIPTPLAIQDDLRVARRGPDWLLLEGNARSQTGSLPAEFQAVTGVGSLPPLAIPPDILSGLRPGQQLDRDPHTGFAIRVAAVDGQTVTLQADGPRQTFLFVYERREGKLVRRVSRDRLASVPGMENVRDLKLADWR